MQPTADVDIKKLLNGYKLGEGFAPVGDTCIEIPIQMKITTARSNGFGFGRTTKEEWVDCGRNIRLLSNGTWEVYEWMPEAEMRKERGALDIGKGQ
jgi:hypothetical protein